MAFRQVYPLIWSLSILPASVSSAVPVLAERSVSEQGATPEVPIRGSETQSPEIAARGLALGYGSARPGTASRPSGPTLVFDGPFFYPVGTAPMHVAACDVTGDGRIDLIAANQFSEGLHLLVGNGDGTFRSGGTILFGRSTMAVECGDLDQDGLPDLVATARVTPPGTPDLTVLLNNGDGTFAVSNLSPPGALYMVVPVVIDLDRDGHLDVVAPDIWADAILLLYGRGDGSFDSPSLLPLPGGARVAVVEDFDNDGVLDVASVNQGPLSVFLGEGNRTFGLRQQYMVAGTPTGLAAADLDGDGAIDLVTANQGSYGLSIFMGRGDGTFGWTRNVPTGPNPWYVSIGDFDLDGLADLVAAINDAFQVGIFLGHGDGTFDPQQTFSAGDDPISVHVVDLQQDGLQDIVTANFYGDDVSVLVNRSTPISFVTQPVTRAIVGELYRYDAEAQHSGGLPLTYSLEEAPGWLTIDPVEGEVTGTPAKPDIGDAEVQIAASDSLGRRAVQRYVLDVLPVLSVTAMPESTSFPRGGILEFDVEVVNNTSDLLTFEGWTEVLTPWGRLIRPVLGPTTVYMTPGSSLRTHVRQRIPRNAPLGGDYLYTVRAGVYPDSTIGEDSFAFDITPFGAGGGSDADDWGLISGWLPGGGLEPSGLGGRPELPRAWALGPSYPNPFNPSTAIPFEVPGAPGESQDIKLEIRDLRGHLVRELVHGERAPGRYVASWGGEDMRGLPLPSGVYWALLKGGGRQRVHKLLLAR